MHATDARFVRSPALLTLVILFLATGQDLVAQKKSVRPGINKSFRRPDVKAFIGRFETESREVFERRKEIIAALSLRKGQSVADIGAGTGLFSRLLAPGVGSRGRVFAVDIAKEFVEHIDRSCREQKITNVQARLCSPTSVGLPDESIDLAFICDTYHHFEFPYKTMRSVWRALRPGGQVVLIDFHRKKGTSSEWVLEHVRAGQKTFVEEIVRSGFEVVDEKTFLKTSYFVRLRKATRRTNRGHTLDSLETVQRLLVNETAVLLDVREQGEWDAGHLEEARLVPLSQLRKSASAKTLPASLARALPRDSIIFCHCRSGGRVLAATRILEKLGYDIRPLSTGYRGLLEAGFQKAR